MAVTIVNGPELEWVNGRDAYETMEPAFRNNFGGDEDQVRGLLSKYWMRSLWLDPESTRRIDHIRTEPGYVDLSEAYHDSVEEGFFRGGDCTLSAEGLMGAGDYFWRPPGWVHKAWTTDGFDTILCMEGEVDSEGSGRVSRVICADHEAGEQSRDGEEGGIGPRGYVRRAESRYMTWRPGRRRRRRSGHLVVPEGQGVEQQRRLRRLLGAGAGPAPAGRSRWRRPRASGSS